MDQEKSLDHNLQTIQEAFHDIQEKFESFVEEVRAVMDENENLAKNQCPPDRKKYRRES